MKISMMAAAGCVWLAAVALIAPQTIVGGFAGGEGRVERDTEHLRGLYADIDPACLSLASEWLRTSVRATVSYGLPTGRAFAAEETDLLQRYALSGCPAGTILVAGAMARETAAEIRTDSGLGNRNMSIGR